MDHSPTRFDDWRIASLLMATIGIICLYQFGLMVDTATMTALSSAALLIVGMPHGSFDLALLQNGSSAQGIFRSRVALISLYLACAAAMYLLWRVVPVAALTAFILMSVIHFAEDWDECGSSFTTLSGQASAAVLADCLLLVAPTMLLLAMVGVAMLWRIGRRKLALSAACAFMAMLVLPPVLGFALFFCLVHSPIQFRAHAAALGLRGISQWGGIVIPLTLGGLGIAVAIFALGSGQSLTDSIFVSSFMALSVLTAPHMAVPVILRMAQGRQPSANL